MATITISPVTRIEGHSRIVVDTDAAGHATGARFQVESFRGFERFLVGVAIERLPALTSRVCGICPIAHQLASLKAIEAAIQASVPPTALRLRELLLMGQFISSHVVSLGLLSLPDLAMPGAEPERRNLVGLMQVDAPLVQAVMALRALGMAISTTVGRREIHVGACVIGGMSSPLTETERQNLLHRLRDAEPAVDKVIAAVRSLLPPGPEIDALGCLPSPSMGLSDGGTLAFYDGQLGLADERGKRLATFDARRYFDAFTEHARDGSYMKFPALKDGRWFRVGPLARLNVNERIGTPWAQRELQIYRRSHGQPAHATLLYHYARAVELVHAWERAIELLEDAGIAGPEVWAPVQARPGTGIGIIEAPRGTLVHHYTVDQKGLATEIRLVVATQHNNDAINATLAALAPVLLDGRPSEATLNRLEMVVRAYDPCLSCATH